MPALGIACRVLNIVHRAERGGPAAEAQLTDGGKPASVSRFAAGDEIVRAEFTLPANWEKRAEGTDSALFIIGAPKPIEFSREKPNWPFFTWLLQHMPEGTKIKLVLKDGRETTLEVADASDWFNPERGFVLAPDLITARARTLGEAASMAGRETRDAVLQVYFFLRRIGSQVSIFGVAGPVTIARVAGEAAYGGVSQLLIFLTLLSANLAVINFLPIPLLDGGHMVFLILEGILRRPVSEKVVVAFHCLGFVFLISLMMFVLGLDFGLIPRPH